LRSREGALLFSDFNQYRAGAVVYWSRELVDGFTLRENGETELTAGIGMLAGLNQSTPHATLEFNVELEFEGASYNEIFGAR